MNKLDDLTKNGALILNFLESLKTNYFEFIYVLLLQDNNHYLYICVLAIIQYLQSLFYFFSPHVRKNKNLNSFIIKAKKLLNFISPMLNSFFAI